MCQMESETTLGWILNLKTMLPEELFLSLSSRMNGVRMPLVEVILQCVKFSMEKEVYLLVVFSYSCTYILLCIIELMRSKYQYVHNIHWNFLVRHFC